MQKQQTLEVRTPSLNETLRPSHARRYSTRLLDSAARRGHEQLSRQYSATPWLAPQDSDAGDEADDADGGDGDNDYFPVTLCSRGAARPRCCVPVPWQSCGRPVEDPRFVDDPVNDPVGHPVDVCWPTRGRSPTTSDRSPRS